MATTEALDLKNEGNSHFVKRHFTEALECYTKGIDIICSDNTTSPKNVTSEITDVICNEELEATLYSNRSGCYYEMGDYENAAIDARKAVQLCMEIMARKIGSAHERGDVGTDITLPPISYKNMYRLARALHFSNADDSEVHYALHLLEEKRGENEEFASKATKLRENLNYYRGISTSNENSDYEPSLLRASFQDPVVEYYNFGHDVSESLLQRNEGSKAQSILLDELEGEELSSLAFLFGGVGDGRHLMASLLDGHYQYMSLSDVKQEKFKLHMTLNDISAQLLAKDTLVLALASELGQLADDVKDALASSDTFDLGMVIYYVTLGYAMPPSVHQNLINFIKRWFTDNTREDFQEKFPWIFISELTWTSILTQMNAWVNPGEHYSPKLHTVKEILAIYKPAGEDAGQSAMNGLASMGGGRDLMCDMEEKMKSAKESRQSQKVVILEQLKAMELQPHMIETAKKVIGDDATEDEIREFWVESLKNVPDDILLSNGSAMYISNMDKLFMQEAKCLYPQGLKEELSKFILGDEPTTNEPSKEEVSEMIQRYKPVIYKDWVTNPVQRDPTYHLFSNGVKDTDEMNPVTEWPSGFLTEKVCSFMSEPPPKLSSSASDDANRMVVKSNNLAVNLIRYYWHVGRALLDLSGKITLEVDLGSIIALGAADRDTRSLPTKYHRITLSNIPDYTGMLSVFTTIAPMLYEKSQNIIPSLQSNCLLNTGLWKSYDDYVFSGAALTYQDAEAVFNLSVTGDEPSVWGPFTVWERSGSEKSLSQEDIRTWIHRLYLMLCLPPDRDCNSTMREEKPGNMSLFLLMLSRCVTHLGIPAHFIASILEDLLKKKHLVTKATLSNEPFSSSLDCDNKSKKTYNHSAFQTGLANETSIFLQHEKLAFRLLDTSMLPVGKASMYELKLSGMPSKWSASWDFTVGSVSSAMSLGFMLQKSKENEYKISTAASSGNGNPMAMMMSMMSGGGMPGGRKKPSKLRRDLLSSGSKIGQVFSCMQWNLENQTVSFWMCDDVFEALKTHYFKLIRTDGWFILPHSDVILGDATKCT